MALPFQESISMEDMLSARSPFILFSERKEKFDFQIKKNSGSRLVSLIPASSFFTMPSNMGLRMRREWEGQALAQARQSMHFSASVSLGLAGSMAPVGQAETQVLQPVHESSAEG